VAQPSTGLAPPDLAAIEAALRPPSDAASVAQRARKRRTALMLLTCLRVVFGAAMGLLAYKFAEKADAYVAVQSLAGALAIVLALGIGRGRGWRGALALVALASFFLPFLFEVRDTQIYCAVLTGNSLLLAAIVSPDIFSQ
jgi:sulfite exporter TauE/SafE